MQFGNEHVMARGISWLWLLRVYEEQASLTDAKVINQDLAEAAFIKKFEQQVC